MTELGSNTTRSRSELVDIMPRARDLAKQLQDATKMPMAVGPPAPEAVAISQAVSAVLWMFEAVDADGHAGRVDRLIEVRNRAESVIQAVQDRLAELQNLSELAIQEQHARAIASESDVVVDHARLEVGLPDGSAAEITVIITPDSCQAIVESPQVDLDVTDHQVTGRVYLRLTGALAQLGEALTHLLPETVFWDNNKST